MPGRMRKRTTPDLDKVAADGARRRRAAKDESPSPATLPSGDTPLISPLNEAATTVPNITVKCVNDRCAMHDREVAVPAGTLLAPGVLATFANMSCSVCGYDLFTVARTQ